MRRVGVYGKSPNGARMKSSGTKETLVATAKGRERPAEARR